MALEEHKGIKDGVCVEMGEVKQKLEALVAYMREAFVRSPWNYANISSYDKAFKDVWWKYTAEIEAMCAVVDGLDATTAARLELMSKSGCFEVAYDGSGEAYAGSQTYTPTKTAWNLDKHHIMTELRACAELVKNRTKRTVDLMSTNGRNVMSTTGENRDECDKSDKSDGAAGIDGKCGKILELLRELKNLAVMTDMKYKVLARRVGEGQETAQRHEELLKQLLALAGGTERKVGVLYEKEVELQRQQEQKKAESRGKVTVAAERGRELDEEARKWAEEAALEEQLRRDKASEAAVMKARGL